MVRRRSQRQSQKNGPWLDADQRARSQRQDLKGGRQGAEGTEIMLVRESRVPIQSNSPPLSSRLRTVVWARAMPACAEGASCFILRGFVYETPPTCAGGRACGHGETAASKSCAVWDGRLAHAFTQGGACGECAEYLPMHG